MPGVIYVCEYHDAILGLWRRQDLRGIRLVHVDAHDDLRGLLVDHRRRRAYPIGSLARKAGAPDPGSFLAHAVLARRLEQILWVHDEGGGRAWDLGIVRYESDLLAAGHRLRNALTREPEYPLEFEELLIRDWRGPKPGQQLSIDWDCFASTRMDAAGIDVRVSAFLDRLGDTIPSDTYVAYSPDYSRPSLGQFEALVERLQRRFHQPVEPLSPALASGAPGQRRLGQGRPDSVRARLIRYLRRRGIY